MARLGPRAAPRAAFRGVDSWPRHVEKVRAHYPEVCRRHRYDRQTHYPTGILSARTKTCGEWLALPTSISTSLRAALHSTRNNRIIGRSVYRYPFRTLVEPFKSQVKEIAPHDNPRARHHQICHQHIGLKPCHHQNQSSRLTSETRSKTDGARKQRASHVTRSYLLDRASYAFFLQWIQCAVHKGTCFAGSAP
jgi:hypothetical protein